MSSVVICVIRINNMNEQVSMSKPCKNCIMRMQYLGIKKIYYSDEKGQITCNKLKDMNTNYVSANDRAYRPGKIIKYT